MFTLEELKTLIQVERDMDEGKTPYIYVEGSNQRASMTPELMNELGLRTGDRVSNQVWLGILRLNLEKCQQELAYQRGQELIKEENIK